MKLSRSSMNELDDTFNNFVFLDLEETLIDNWYDFNLLPDLCAKVDRYIHGKAFYSDPTTLPRLHVGLMSWAVYDDRDKQMFMNVKHHIEEKIGYKFDDNFVWSMDDWAKLVYMHRGLKLDRADMFELFSKREVLMALANHEVFFNSFVTLIDDRVEHQFLIQSRANRCSITLNNIKDM